MKSCFDIDSNKNTIIFKAIEVNCHVYTSSSSDEYTIMSCLVSMSGNVYALEEHVSSALYGRIIQGCLLNFKGNRLYCVSNKRVAIKEYMKFEVIDKINKGSQENPFNEMTAMECFRNNGGDVNVIQVHEICETEHNLYSIMEFAELNLLKYMMNNITDVESLLHESEIRFVFRQIVNGLRFMHSLHYAHRDISLENIVITNNGICKIIDFGLALHIPFSNGKHLNISKKPMCGKKVYFSSEIIRPKSSFQPMHFDVWSLGIILYCLITGEYPYEDTSDKKFKQVVSGNVANLIPPNIKKNLSDEIIGLLTKILKDNPNERPSIDEIISDPWMQSVDVKNPFIFS